MRPLLCCALLAAALPLVFASLGVDVSIPVSQSQFACMKSQGYTFAIVRCWRSSGTPDSACPGTVAAAWAAGFTSVDVYMFPDYSAGNPQGQVQQAVNFLKTNNVRYGKFWIDVEQPPNWGSCTANAQFLQNIVSQAQSLGQSVGIYTSNAMWQPMLCGSKNFAQLPLWYPHYDNNPSFSDFQPFGGWTTPMLKQYKGDATVCGVDADVNYGGGSAATATATHATTAAGPATNGPATHAATGPASHATTGPATHATTGPANTATGPGTTTGTSASSGNQTASHIAASASHTASHAASHAASHSASQAASHAASHSASQAASHAASHTATSGHAQSSNTGGHSSATGGTGTGTGGSSDAAATSSSTHHHHQRKRGSNTVAVTSAAASGYGSSGSGQGSSGSSGSYSSSYNDATGYSSGASRSSSGAASSSSGASSRGSSGSSGSYASSGGSNRLRR